MWLGRCGKASLWAIVRTPPSIILCMLHATQSSLSLPTRRQLMKQAGAQLLINFPIVKNTISANRKTPARESYGQVESLK